MSCNQRHSSFQENIEESKLDYPDSVYDYLAIPKSDKLSAASKRALERNYAQGPEWYMEFKVHDPTLLYYNNKFYLYYKGERMGERKTFGGREIKCGVAIADQRKDLYIKSEYNPITNSGHKLCVWPYDGGIAALIITDGSE